MSRDYMIPTGIDAVPSASGRDCWVRQMTPPSPTGSGRLRRVRKAFMSRAPGEAVRLISRGWITPSRTISRSISRCSRSR